MSLDALVRLDGEKIDPEALDALLPPAEVARQRARIHGEHTSSTFVCSDFFTSDRDEIAVAVDGRFDNQLELSSSARLQSSGFSTSDSAARLLLHGFTEAGASFLGRLLGSWACVIHDRRTRTLWLGRDPLGGKTLFYRVSGSSIAISSDPDRLRRIEGAATPDETSIARFLAALGPVSGASFFQEISELPPGAVLRSTDRGSEILRQVSVPSIIEPEATGQAEAEELFRRHFDSAVASCIGGGDRVAVLLSGGLDSTSIAVSAARHLRDGGRGRLSTISWVYRDLQGIDESPWIDAINRQIDAMPTTIVSDDLYPTVNDPSGWQELDSPVRGAYRRLYEAAFDSARRNGSSLVLTGDGGDHLWRGDPIGLGDLLRSGQWTAAMKTFVRAIRRRGARSRLRRSIGRFLAGPLQARRGPAPEWLTPYARELVTRSLELEDSRREGVSAQAVDLPLESSLELYQLGQLSRQAERFELELRHPFRDRRLIEHVIGLSASLARRAGGEKHLLKRALRERLPAEILQRRVRTTFLPLFDRGIGERDIASVRKTLADREAIWRRYVRPEWLSRDGLGALGSSADEIGRVVLWHCLAVESWQRALSGTFDSKAVRG